LRLCCLYRVVILCQRLRFVLTIFGARAYINVGLCMHVSKRTEQQCCVAYRCTMLAMAREISAEGQAAVINDCNCYTSASRARVVCVPSSPSVRPSVLICQLCSSNWKEIPPPGFNGTVTVHYWHCLYAAGSM